MPDVSFGGVSLQLRALGAAGLVTCRREHRHRFYSARREAIGPGESRVTIDLAPVSQGTRLHLAHAFADAAVRDNHVQGWRYQLSVFANVVADEIHGNVAELVDGWFDAWAETDAERRAAELGRVAVAGVRMRDRFSCVDSAAELTEHIAGSQRFMPGFRLQRAGAPRHCQ